MPVPRNRRERRHPELIGVHYRTFRRWISDGRINAVRIGPRLLKVDMADVEKLARPVGGAA
jgi:excisionase family DNA binding protein